MLRPFLSRGLCTASLLGAGARAWPALGARSAGTARVALLSASSLPATLPSNTRSNWSGTRGLAAVLGALSLGAATQGPTRCENGDTLTVKPEPPSLIQRCIAEAVGVGIIVQIGCGVEATALYTGAALHNGPRAFIWGAGVALAVYVTRDISGAHLNPAVTAALTAHKDFPVEEAVPYVGAQMAGATIAGAVNYFIFRSGIAALEAKEVIIRGAAGSWASCSGVFGMTPNPLICSIAGAFLLEVWMTAILACVIFSVTDENSTVPDGAAPALIGTTVALLVAIFGPVTGCGMNPARDLGPRLVTALAGWGAAAGSGGAWWVFTAGPVVGAVLGGLFYQTCLRAPKKE